MTQTARLQVEIRCPHCGGSQAWFEHQRLNRCEYCGSTLYFEEDSTHRFYLEPTARTVEDVKEVLVVAHATRKRAEKMARYPSPYDDRPQEMLSVIPVELGPFLREMSGAIKIRKTLQILAPYRHFQATLFQSFLAQDSHAAKKYSLRRVPVDETLPGYDAERWNFRDRGLRFGQGRFKQIDKAVLEKFPHLPFIDNNEVSLEKIVRGYQPAEEAQTYLFKHHVLTQRNELQVFRPYWIVEYQLRGTQYALVDGTFGTVAGYPNASECNRFFDSVKKPYATENLPTVKVISSRCPECGEDSHWRVRELLHLCSNCGRMLRLDRSGIQTERYLCTPESNNSCVYIPFWKFPVNAVLGGKRFESLRALYRQFFQERLLASCRTMNNLFVPAITMQDTAEGDLLFEALLADAPAKEGDLVDHRVRHGVFAYPVEFSAASASKVLNTLLPSASHVHPSLHRSGVLTNLVKKTELQLAAPVLVLIAYQHAAESIIVGKRSFPLQLFETD